jgi:hypothetical protein
MVELGWTVANPPETVLSSVACLAPLARSSLTEELLSTTALLNDLDQTGLQLLDRGNVVGENTHLTGLGGDVDLDNIL